MWLRTITYLLLISQYWLDICSIDPPSISAKHFRQGFASSRDQLSYQIWNSSRKEDRPVTVCHLITSRWEGEERNKSKLKSLTGYFSEFRFSMSKRAALAGTIPSLHVEGAHFCLVQISCIRHDVVPLYTQPALLSFFRDKTLNRLASNNE